MLNTIDLYCFCRKWNTLLILQNFEPLGLKVTVVVVTSLKMQATE